MELDNKLQPDRPIPRLPPPLAVEVKQEDGPSLPQELPADFNTTWWFYRMWLRWKLWKHAPSFPTSTSAEALETSSPNKPYEEMSASMGESILSEERLPRRELG